MTVTNIFRMDDTNVGDWWCPPALYFPDLAGDRRDILEMGDKTTFDRVVLGGGGLIAKTFEQAMIELAEHRPPKSRVVAWGVGESLNVDRSGGFVPPYEGPLPEYLKMFDLVGVRDFGTSYRWTPCASCMSPVFDTAPSPTQDVVIYEHKRIPIPIQGPERRSNSGNDLEGVAAFLASAETVITNSYHGAYWATLLGRRVVAIPNMSKLYRLKHAPTLCRAEEWRRYLPYAVAYPEALEECRAANLSFMNDVRGVLQLN